MANEGFDFAKFINDTKDLLVSPKTYFESMPKTGGIIDPIIRVVIYGVIAGVLSFVWGIMNFTPLGIFGAGIGTGIGIAKLITLPIFALIGLFIGAIIILIMSAICGGSTDFESNLRVSASLMALYPVRVLFEFTYIFSFYLEAVIVLLISLYGIWLLYNALIKALGAKEGSAKIAAIILAIFPVLALLNTIACHSAMSGFTNQMMQGANQQEEAIKQAQKLMEQMQKTQKQ